MKQVTTILIRDIEEETNLSLQTLSQRFSTNTASQTVLRTIAEMPGLIEKNDVLVNKIDALYREVRKLKNLNKDLLHALSKVEQTVIVAKECYQNEVSE